MRSTKEAHAVKLQKVSTIRYSLSQFNTLLRHVKRLLLFVLDVGNLVLSDEDAKNG